MELLFIWLLFGIITAVVASNKGRSGFGWFLIGVLFGPFGLILALVISKDVDAIEKADLRSGKLKKCHHCAELVKREAVKCRHCGEAIDSDTAPYLSQADRALKEAGKKFQIR